MKLRPLIQLYLNLTFDQIVAPNMTGLFFVTTDSTAERFGTQGEVALLLDSGSQWNDMNCAVVPQQAWVNGVMTSGRGY